MNAVQIIGTLGRKPELKIVGEGTKLCAFSIAVKDERREYTSWINVVAFGPVATTCASFDKGDRLFVAGKLQEDRWEKEGQKHSRTKIVADFVSKQEFVEKKLKQDVTGEQTEQTAPSTQPETQGVTNNDDLPF